MNWLSALFRRNATPVAALSPEQAQALSGWRDLAAGALDLPHARQRYVVVDVETSGLDVRRDRLIAIGAVAVNGGLVDFADAFQIVLHQTEASSTDNILIHGIGAGEQSTGVAPVDALLAFLAFVGRSPLVALSASSMRKAATVSWAAACISGSCEACTSAGLAPSRRRRSASSPSLVPAYSAFSAASADAASVPNTASTSAIRCEASSAR